MIRATVNQERGSVNIIGEDIPDGLVTLTRNRAGALSYVLRNGMFDLTTGGFIREDAEAPFGMPLRYDLDLVVADRLIQSNYVLTPDFLRGQHNWQPGPERTVELSTVQVADTGLMPVTTLLPSSDLLPSPTVSKVVGKFSSGDPDPTPVLPSLVWHGESALTTSSYTITLPSSGPTAALGGDLVVLVYLGTGTTDPTVSTPMTKIARQVTGGLTMNVWAGRYAGNHSVTVGIPAGQSAMGTAMLVRNAGDPTPGPFVNGHQTWPIIEVPGTTQAFPALVLAAMTAITPVPATPSWDYNGENGWFHDDGHATVAVVQYTTEETSTIPLTYMMFDSESPDWDAMLPTSALGLLITIPTTTTTANRVVATNKIDALPANKNPYLMTGRFRFEAPDLWTWTDVLEQGTWQTLKDTKGSWAEVQSAESLALGNQNYLNLYVQIVDAIDPSIIYVDPVPVIGANAKNSRAWNYFSFFFDPAVDIPAGSLIQVFHGGATREYAITWFFDMFLISSVKNMHQFVYYFSGDTTTTNNSQNYYAPGGDWLDKGGDADFVWTGEPGNSVSAFIGPSRIGLSITTRVDARTDVCEPVYLNDPISPPRGQWFALMNISDLSYSARQQTLSVINRPDLVVISQRRQWASGSITLKTETRAERDLAVQIFETGRVLYFRNADPRYPETEWYLAVGDVTESRPIPNHRDPRRIWTVPFVRVERPAGMIESAAAVTWQQILESGMSWAEVRDQNLNWLDVMS